MLEKLKCRAKIISAGVDSSDAKDVEMFVVRQREVSFFAKPLSFGGMASQRR